MGGIFKTCKRSIRNYLEKTNPPKITIRKLSGFAKVLKTYDFSNFTPINHKFTTPSCECFRFSQVFLNVSDFGLGICNACPRAWNLSRIYPESIRNLSGNYPESIWNLPTRAATGGHERPLAATGGHGRPRVATGSHGHGRPRAATH